MFECFVLKLLSNLALAVLSLRDRLIMFWFCSLNLVYFISFDSSESVYSLVFSLFYLIYSLFFSLFYLNNTIYSLHTSKNAMLLNDITLKYWIVFQRMLFALTILSSTLTYFVCVIYFYNSKMWLGYMYLCSQCTWRKIFIFPV